MNKRSLGALIALNLVLLVALAVVNLKPTPARAQAFGGAGGDYVMLSGAVKGRNQQNAVYIIELSTARMIAVMFNSNSGKLEVLDARDVTGDTQGGR